MTKKVVFLKIYSFFLVFLLAVSIGRGFMALWFVRNGFSYSQVALFYLIDFLTPSLSLLFVKKFSTGKSLSLALVSEILLMLSFFHFFHPWQLYFSGILAGMTVVLFYITYNTLYFKNTPKDKRALSSSLFTLAGPFLGISIPLIVGFIGQKWGFPSIFLLSFLILTVNLYLIRILPKIKFQTQLKESLRKTGSINFLLFIEGIKETVSLAAMPLFTLFFITEPLKYGIYFSYLAFVSTAATILLGYLSDKYKKRTFILYPVTGLVGITIISLGLAQNLIWWAIASGILGFIATINATFVTTLVLDQVSQVKEAMIGREFLLGIGRGFGMLLIIGSLTFFNSPKIALILIGSFYLLFPFTVWRKKLYHPSS